MVNETNLWFVNKHTTKILNNQFSNSLGGVRIRLLTESSPELRQQRTGAADPL